MTDRLFFAAVLVALPALLVGTLAESMRVAAGAEARALAAAPVVQLERVVITVAPTTAVAATEATQPTTRAVQ